jgi:hypothetical protein
MYPSLMNCLIARNYAGIAAVRRGENGCEHPMAELYFNVTVIPRAGQDRPSGVHAPPNRQSARAMVYNLELAVRVLIRLGSHGHSGRIRWPNNKST